MRFAARLTGVLLLIVGLAGCDKAQIAQLESQNATITITAIDTLAELFNVWDFTEITDLDMLNGPDDPTVYLYCESVPVFGSPPPPPIQIPVQTAWQHSLRVSVLRADSTEFEQITDDMYLSSSSNLTPYDDQVISGNNVTKSDLTVMDGTVLRTFHWNNGTKRQLTSINRNVIVATSNPLNDFDPVTYGFRNGLCSVSIDPGPSSLAGAPQPFTFELGKGDTLKVEARKAVDSLGFVDQMGNPLTVIEPKLVGRLAIDGTNITNLGGDASSAAVVGDGFSFFYSSR